VNASFNLIPLYLYTTVTEINNQNTNSDGWDGTFVKSLPSDDYLQNYKTAEKLRTLQLKRDDDIKH
jgi:hypothetical protein